MSILKSACTGSSRITKQKEQSWPLKKLIEGEHYYLEDGKMVLTERYHLLRGRCCGNGCRHCPFNYCNVKNKNN